MTTSAYASIAIVRPGKEIFTRFGAVSMRAKSSQQASYTPYTPVARKLLKELDLGWAGLHRHVAFDGFLCHPVDLLHHRQRKTTRESETERAHALSDVYIDWIKHFHLHSNQLAIDTAQRRWEIFFGMRTVTAPGFPDAELDVAAACALAPASASSCAQPRALHVCKYTTR